MSNDFIGFNFLPSSMHPVSDIRRGYVAGPVAALDAHTTGTTSVVGASITGDTTTQIAANLTTGPLHTTS